MDNRTEEIKLIFSEAYKKKTPRQRKDYLDKKCGTDTDLRAEVESLLESYEDAEGFLDAPVLNTDVTLNDSILSECPGSVIGRYKLLEKIGEGGMAVVYMAEQTEPIHRKVALKIIKVGMDTKSVIARFEVERQALAMMDHPNIAKVLDAGATETGRPYFVMELIKGIPITQYCDTEMLSTQKRLDLFVQVCNAVQHAHQKGIIHRDIKPSNVMVTLHDDVAVPKVIDFGIAKATDQKLTERTLFTRYAQIIGTPVYMSPEQAAMSGLDIDTRSDIYSLGVLLYELLTGRTPFDEKELMKSGVDRMRKIIREQDPPTPSTKFATLDIEEQSTTALRHATDSPRLISLLRGDLDWIVMKCLEKNRTRRYETANGLALDVGRHLSNEPVIARPPTAIYQLQKAWRRNKVVFTAATAVAATLVVGIALSTWQTVRATRAEREQSNLREVAIRALEGEKTQRVLAETERQRADAQARKLAESLQQSRRLLYAADISLAQQSIKQNNLGRARRLLNRNRPQPGDEDLRGWEWRYLWQLTRSSALVTLTNRRRRGLDVSFSPDGSRLAVGWQYGHVDLWDVPGRRLVRALADREDLFPYQGRVAFSPVRNLLAATSELKLVTLYDLDSGREAILLRLPDQGEWYVHGLSFSQDGSRVVISAISNEENGRATWVVNISSAKIEGHYATQSSDDRWHGYARLSTDNRRLYVSRQYDSKPNRYSIQCLQVNTGQEVWQTESQEDLMLTALAVSPDGRVIASGSGYEDPAIYIWDAATGKCLRQLDGHSAWVCDLTFTRDGRSLISAGTDQSIRFWDTGTWSETQVLRGHTDEVHGVAISETAQLIASTGKDGNLILWRVDEKRVTDGYMRLSTDLDWHGVMPLDGSRVLLLPPDRPPEWRDLKRDAPPVSLPELGDSTNVLAWFRTNILCRWNGAGKIIVSEWSGARFVQRGAVTVDSGTRPVGLAYNFTRRLLAWIVDANSTSVYLATLDTPGRRIELRSDVSALSTLLFSEDGNHLAAITADKQALRAWNVDTGQIVASVNERIGHPMATFAANNTLVVGIDNLNGGEFQFYDLADPNLNPRHFPERHFPSALAVSPDGKLVACATGGGRVRLFDSATGELIDTVQGQLNAVSAVAFSPDGRRLISAFGGREAVKLWDVDTGQELLTLGGLGSWLDAARWTADGDVILAGAPWQAWRVPSWEEIAAAEAKER
ncbi:MAG: protein kinase [Sedimentisphaerales bacterium]